MWPKILLGAVILFAILLVINLYFRYSNNLNQKLKTKKQFLRVRTKSSTLFYTRLHATYTLLALLALSIAAMMITPSLVFLRPVIDEEEYQELMDPRLRLMVNPSHEKARQLTGNVNVSTSLDKKAITTETQTIVLSGNVVMLFDFEKQDTQIHEYPNVDLVNQNMVITESYIIVFRNEMKSRSAVSSIYMHHRDNLQVERKVDTNGHISHLHFDGENLYYDAMNNFYTTSSLRTVHIRFHGTLVKVETQNRHDVLYLSEVGNKRQVSMIRINIETHDINFHSFLVSDSFSIGHGNRIIYAFNNINYKEKASTTAIIDFSWDQFRIQKMLSLEGLTYRPITKLPNGNIIIQTIVRNEENNTHHVYELTPSISFVRKTSTTLPNDFSLYMHDGKQLIVDESSISYTRDVPIFSLMYGEKTWYRAVYNQYLIEIKEEENIVLSVCGYQSPDNYVVYLLPEVLNDTKKFDFLVEEDILWIFANKEYDVVVVSVNVLTGEVEAIYQMEYGWPTKVFFASGYVVFANALTQKIFDRTLQEIKTIGE